MQESSDAGIQATANPGSQRARFAGDPRTIQPRSQGSKNPMHPSDRESRNAELAGQDGPLVEPDAGDPLDALRGEPCDDCRDDGPLRAGARPCDQEDVPESDPQPLHHLNRFLLFASFKNILADPVQCLG
eukprot:gene16056-biopygen10131